MMPQRRKPGQRDGCVDEAASRAGESYISRMACANAAVCLSAAGRKRAASVSAKSAAALLQEDERGDAGHQQKGAEDQAVDIGRGGGEARSCAMQRPIPMQDEHDLRHQFGRDVGDRRGEGERRIDAAQDHGASADHDAAELRERQDVAGAVARLARR